jgi:phage FluMu gp28-like protein
MFTVSENLLLPYQRRWIEDTSRRKLWLASRQVGKSFALSLEAVKEALNSRCDNLLLSSSERQSRELMRKVRLHLQSFQGMNPGFYLDGDRAEEVQFENGSRVISLPANPDTVRGFSGNLYLDEFAFHSDDREIWRAMYPTVTRGYKVRICSTPNGKANMFFDLWANSAREGQSPESGYSRHRTDIHQAVAEGLSANVSELRDGVGDAETWAQEFECRFLDGATAFIPLGLIAQAEDPAASIELSELSLEGEYYLGVDIGRIHDLTVMWLLEKVGDVYWTRQVREMRGAAFSLQRDTLYSLLDSANVRRVSIDSTGIGNQLAEETQDKYRGRAEGVHFTQASKEDMAVSLRRAFEDRLLRLPASPAIREDIHSVRRSVTSTGSLRFSAQRSGAGHADRFWALALALHASDTGPSPEVHYEALIKRSPRSGLQGCF